MSKYDNPVKDDLDYVITSYLENGGTVYELLNIVANIVEYMDKYGGDSD